MYLFIGGGGLRTKNEQLPLMNFEKKWAVLKKENIFNIPRSNLFRGSGFSLKKSVFFSSLQSPLGSEESKEIGAKSYTFKKCGAKSLSLKEIGAKQGALAPLVALRSTLSKSMSFRSFQKIFFVLLFY